MAVDILLSYAYNSKTDLEPIRQALGSDQKLMIDSGAFSAFTKGVEISLPQYIEYLRRWKGTYDHAVTLDVIGKPKETARNLLKLQDLGLPIIPVYTARARIEELRALAKDYDYVAYGGTVGSPKAIQQRATKVVVEEAAVFGAKIHALGQASLPMFRMTNAYSGDSSTGVRAPIDASVSCYDPFGHQMVLVAMGDRAPWLKHHDLLKAYGLSARLCLSGEAIRGVKNRTNSRRVGVLSTAIQAAEIKGTKDYPRIYNALTTNEDINAACQAAIQWRTGDLPRPLNRMKS